MSTFNIAAYFETCPRCEGKKAICVGFMCGSDIGCNALEAPCSACDSTGYVLTVGEEAEKRQEEKRRKEKQIADDRCVTVRLADAMELLDQETRRQMSFRQLLAICKAKAHDG